MLPEPSLSGLAKSIDGLLEEHRTPRTLAERLLAAGANFIFAIGFFALGITANVVAAEMSTTGAFIFAVVGVIVLKIWSLAREYEGARDELKDAARDARLVLMVVEQTIDALEKRQQAKNSDAQRVG